MKKIELLHGTTELPTFFPDGTYGVVKTIDTFDLANCNIDGIVMNAFHLYTKPGLNIIKKHGGINSFINWQKPVLTASGGFQIFSLLRENPKYGQVRENEIIFRPNMDDEKIVFSPQKSIQLQFAVKSDVVVCLDICTHADDDYEVQVKSVDTTIKWAHVCKKEYDLQCKNYKYTRDKRPLLFAVIQGGNDKMLRSKCAEALIKIGFDGFGYGGWPLDSAGKLMEDMLLYTASLMPDDSVKYAMGIGKPEEIVKCVDMGYNLFDCVIPTREARHQRLYAYNVTDSGEIDVYSSNKFYSYVYILDDRYATDISPVSEVCDCHCCKNYSKSYLRHLFKIGDPLSLRLATIHNLRFYSMLMELIRKGRERLE